MGHKASLALTAVVALLTGCTTVTSTSDETFTEPSAGANDGLTYFLPRQLATVTAKRVESRLSKRVTGLAKAQTAVVEAEAALAASEAAVDRLRSQIAVAENTNRRILSSQLADAQADVRAARKEVSSRQTKLTAAADALKAEVAAGRSTAPGGYDVSLAISLLPPSADPDFAYRLNPRHSVMRDDEHKLTIAKSGLLTTTNTVAADRTADILVEIGTFAGAITRLPVAGITPNNEGANPNLCVDAPDEFTGIVDFADDTAVAALNYDLQCLGVRVALEKDGRVWTEDSKPKPHRRNAIEGIVYRTPVERLVRVEKCTAKAGNCTETSGWYATQVVALSLPQAGPISVVQQDAGLMTKSRYTLAFDSGVLTSYDASRPSEVLEVARTPMRLVNGVFDGISKVISLRTGQANGLAGLSAAELALLNARAAEGTGAINNQRVRTEAELALLRAQFALQAGTLEGQRTLSEAELALLRAQIAQQAGVVEGQRTLTAADLALLQMQLQLQGAGITGATQLTNNQLALLHAQTGYTVAQGNVPVQLSTARLAAMIAMLQNQAREDAITRCISERIAAATTPSAASIDLCLQAP